MSSLGTAGSSCGASNGRAKPASALFPGYCQSHALLLRIETSQPWLSTRMSSFRSSSFGNGCHRALAPLGRCKGTIPEPTVLSNNASKLFLCFALVLNGWKLWTRFIFDARQLVIVLLGSCSAACPCALVVDGSRYFAQCSSIETGGMRLWALLGAMFWHSIGAALPSNAHGNQCSGDQLQSRSRPSSRTARSPKRDRSRVLQGTGEKMHPAVAKQGVVLEGMCRCCATISWSTALSPRTYIPHSVNDSLQPVLEERRRAWRRAAISAHSLSSLNACYDPFCSGSPASLMGTRRQARETWSLYATTIARDGFFRYWRSGVKAIHGEFATVVAASLLHAASAVADNALLS